MFGSGGIGLGDTREGVTGAGFGIAGTSVPEASSTGEATVTGGGSTATGAGSTEDAGVVGRSVCTFGK